MKNASVFVSVVLICLLGVSCGPSGQDSGANSTQASPTNALEQYVYEVGIQYDIFLEAYEEGQFNDAQLKEYLQSWEKIATLFSEAQALLAEMTPAKRVNFHSDNFCYPYLIDPITNVNNQFVPAGFYGEAIYEDRDEIMLEDIARVTPSYEVLYWSNDRLQYGAIITYNALIAEFSPLMSGKQVASFKGPLKKAVEKTFGGIKIPYEEINYDDWR